MWQHQYGTPVHEAFPRSPAQMAPSPANTMTVNAAATVPAPSLPPATQSGAAAVQPSLQQLHYHYQNELSMIDLQRRKQAEEIRRLQQQLQGAVGAPSFGNAALAEVQPQQVHCDALTFPYSTAVKFAAGFALLVLVIVLILVSIHMAQSSAVTSKVYKLYRSLKNPSHKDYRFG